MTYTCEKCGVCVQEDTTCLAEFPEYYDQPQMIELMIDLSIVNEKPRKDPERYHYVHEYGRWGGTARMSLCGPVRTSSSQEDFIDWISSSKIKR